MSGSWAGQYAFMGSCFMAVVERWCSLFLDCETRRAAVFGNPLFSTHIVSSVYFRQ